MVLMLISYLFDSLNDFSGFLTIYFFMNKKIYRKRYLILSVNNLSLLQDIPTQPSTPYRGALAYRTRQGIREGWPEPG